MLQRNTPGLLIAIAFIIAVGAPPALAVQNVDRDFADRALKVTKGLTKVCPTPKQVALVTGSVCVTILGVAIEENHEWSIALKNRLFDLFTK